MANTTTIKQRFMDILFEDEDDLPVKREKVEKPKPVILEKPKYKSEVTPINAKDFLYGKKENQSNTFINLDEGKKIDVKAVVEQQDDFVATPNLSPIFGTIDNKTRKSNEETSVDYASVQKSDTNYLDMVLSPIYGYDTKQANEARSSLVVEKNPEIKSVDVTDDLFNTTKLNTIPKKTIKKEVKDDIFSRTSEIDLFSDFYLDKED